MSFNSLLFTRSASLQPALPAQQQPVFFTDLNLDQIVDAVTAGKEEYNLKPFFYTVLHDRDAIIYRQEIMRDIESPALFSQLKAFAESMRSMRQILARADKCSYKYQKERFFLDAVQAYCKGISALALHLSSGNLQSIGLVSFHRWLLTYMQSADFASLLAEMQQLLADLSDVTYCVVNKELRVQVIACKQDPDYTEEVKQLFEKFKQDAVKDYLVEFSDYPELNHVESAILDGVAELYPELFRRLDEFYSKNNSFEDESIKAFDREIQFYIAYLEYVEKLKKAGLPFCYPELSTVDKKVSGYETFDLALAYKLMTENSATICNDFYLTGQERIIVVTGPNQGGKTTFARTFGQLHYLAVVGCPIPGREAHLFLFDKLFTHFEKEESIKTLRSKFEDDLVRIHSILNEATTDSIVIMNEILSSTSLQDAVYLSREIMEKIIELDALCVWVTFIDELISLSDKIVSMSSTVEKDNPASRTFKVVRKPADGLAYALSIAEKYKVTYAWLKERIRS